jgi:hypothetical protein
MKQGEDFVTQFFSVIGDDRAYFFLDETKSNVATPCPKRGYNDKNCGCYL